MSNMSEHASTIAELEAQGYQIIPPRRIQQDWENKIGLWMQSFELIQMKYDRHEVTMSGRSLTTLEHVKERLDEMLARATQEQEVA